MNHKGIIDFFSYRRPTPKEILERYGKRTDLSKYSQLQLRDVFYAIINCKTNEAIIIPENVGMRLLEVKGYSPEKYNSCLIHWLYAPDVMLNTTAMTVEQAKSFRLNEAVREARWSYDVPHRGFGVIDPRTHIEIIWPFIYLVEGWKLADLARDLIKITSGYGIDITGRVPSISSLSFHTVTLKNVSEDMSTLIQLYADCTCLWTHYGLRRREERRYKGGERVMCRHGIAFYRLLEATGKVETILPRPTGILNPWFTLKSRTIVGDEKITRTQMNALLGMIAAYMKEEGVSPWV